jgi:hypothetical protein
VWPGTTINALHCGSRHGGGRASSSKNLGAGNLAVDGEEEEAL